MKAFLFSTFKRPLKVDLAFTIRQGINHWIVDAGYLGEHGRKRCCVRVEEQAYIGTKLCTEHHDNVGHPCDDKHGHVHHNGSHGLLLTIQNRVEVLALRHHAVECAVAAQGTRL